MPSTSQSQQIAAAIALKAKKEGKVNDLPKNSASKKMSKMSAEELEKFARTKHKGLPKKKITEAFGQKLDIYINIIWRYFENRGFSDSEIENILNTPENISMIESGEYSGINPIQIARSLNIEVLTESVITRPASEYSIGAGSLGNGLSIWDRSREEGGEYKKIAHIGTDGKVNIYDLEMPDEIRRKIYRMAKISDDNGENIN